MLHYHLILCIKYRHKVIDDTISNRLKEIFVKIAHAYNITLEEWNHDIDHVHILFRGHPNTEMSKLIIQKTVLCKIKLVEFYIRERRNNEKIIKNFSSGIVNQFIMWIQYGVCRVGK